MSPISIGLIAIGMSVDAFIAALGRGARARPGLGQALRTGLLFGVIEALTPLIGWALGMAASSYVAAVDHWIAFGLLAGVGARMALHALQRQPEDSAPPAQGFWPLVATAVGTSVDAMAVGVSLAFLEVNILVIAAAIGVASMAMASTGLLAGHLLGRRFGRLAEILGGLALMGLGLSILIEHLGA